MGAVLHYTNTQALWETENQKKHTTVPDAE